MEKRQIKHILRRWWWLFLLAMAAAGAITYLAGSQQPPLYETAVRLVVGPGIDSPSPDLNDLRAGGQLMQTYAELPRTEPFLQAVIDQTGINIDAQELADMIEVRANAETQIMTIDVRSLNGVEAITLANAIADQLVRVSPSGTETAAALLNQRIANQATQLETAIAENEARIAALEQTLGTTPAGEQQPEMISLLWEERARLSEAHNTLAELYGALQATATNQVKVIEPASRATPILSTLWLKVAIGAASGLILSLGLVLAYEYMNDAVDPARDLAASLEVPVLGAVERHRSLPGSGRSALAVEALPDSAAAESYRKLGIRLLFSSHEERPVRSILLSSVNPDEDVGEIAANLAVVLAQTGSRVALVDANLYHPTIDRHFGVANRCGLADVLSGECRSIDLTVIDWAPGLSVLPAGTVTDNSFVLLASPRMLEVLQELAQQVDIVLIAGSPLSRFADSLFLASRVDGVALVTHTSQTRRAMLHDTIGSLRSVGAYLIGSILRDPRWETVLPARTNGKPAVQPDELETVYPPGE